MREHEREFERCGLVTEILVDRSPVVAALPDREFAVVLTTSAPAPLIYIEAFRRVIVIIQWRSCQYWINVGILTNGASENDLGNLESRMLLCYV